ncbi:hypothetical protein [Alkalibacillus aidingensis]|uniref:hypothetical protein n=1 Tax=Alkalibacillus aidingensis TaxID=2747607 RepID=UPI0016617C6C|nr:hypothetical protein [Alkalibacillus aidingensis]
MERDKRIEVVLWSIALPGFGQLINKRFIKGAFFIFLEILINVQARLNFVIIPSFHGDIQMAIDHTNYQWVMFYPCLYMFSIYDAYKDAGGARDPYAYLPFTLAAFIGTIGVIYSPIFNVNGIYPGIIWLPIIFTILAFIIGYVIKKVLQTRLKQAKLP